jgi:hypothetical protein
MKKYFYCFLIVAQSILLGCGSHQPKDGTTAEAAIKFEGDTFKIGDKTFFIEQITRSDFDKSTSTILDSSEKRNILQDSLLVKRTADTLILKISNGKTVSLVNNNSDNDSYTQYSYRGKLSDIGQFIVSVSHWEGHDYLLINESSGDKMNIIGIPKLSPNKKYLITSNNDLFAENTFNGFELFRIDNKIVKLIGKKELTEWGPEDIKWVNDSVILVERTIKDTTQANMERKDFIKLLMK